MEYSHHSENKGNTMKISHAKNHGKHYVKLLVMMILSYIMMYILMYAMVDRLENVIPNVNQFYMAGLMTSPMLIIELLLMGEMYHFKKLNIALIIIGFLSLLLFWFAIRKQTSVGDIQFLKSMIPHHAGAVLMVEESDLKDPQTIELSKKIISSQKEEIEFMKKRIKELEEEK